MFEVDDKQIRLVQQTSSMDVDENEIDEMDYQSSQYENSLNNGHDKEEHWFCFDDSIVTCVTREHIKRHYAQNDCAYMLFYRQKIRNRQRINCSDSKETCFRFNIIKTNCILDTHYSVPQWLVDEISEENRILAEKRYIIFFVNG